MAALVAQVIPEAERHGRRARRRPAVAPTREPRRRAPSSTPRPSLRRARGPIATKISCCSRPSARACVIVEGELSGLRELRRNMGEARAREALLDFLRVTEHVAYKHQAHPDRLDDRGFTYVLGLPVGTEDDAGRAVELGARAHRRARRHLARSVAAAQPRRRPLARHGAGLARTPAGRQRARRQRFQYELLGQHGADRAAPGDRGDAGRDPRRRRHLPRRAQRLELRGARGHRAAARLRHLARRTDRVAAERDGAARAPRSIACSGRGRAPIGSPITRACGAWSAATSSCRCCVDAHRAVIEQQPRPLRARARRRRRGQGQHRRRLPRTSSIRRRTWSSAASAARR